MSTSTDEQPELQHLDSLHIRKDFTHATFDNEDLPLVQDGFHWETAINHPRGIDVHGATAAGEKDGMVVVRGRVQETEWVELGDRLKLYVQPHNGSISYTGTY